MCDNRPAAFQIDARDNVATALREIPEGVVRLLGDAAAAEIDVVRSIPSGHKLALRDIAAGEDIVKYGVPIGRATGNIRKGDWVHLHCMESKFDEKSRDLDVATGISKSTVY